MKKKPKKIYFDPTQKELVAPKPGDNVTFSCGGSFKIFGVDGALKATGTGSITMKLREKTTPEIVDEFDAMAKEGYKLDLLDFTYRKAEK